MAELIILVVSIFVFFVPLSAFAQIDDTCSLRLFAGENVEWLVWNEPDESFIVGLGQMTGSEFLLEYKLVDYSEEAVLIQDYELPTIDLAFEIAGEAGFIEELLDDSYDSYPLPSLLISPNEQYALYWKMSDEESWNPYSYQLFALDIQTGTERKIADTVLGDVPFAYWITEDEVLLVTHYPVGDGYLVMAVCLHEECAIPYTQIEGLDTAFGMPGFSQDGQYMLAPSFIPDDPLRLYEQPFQENDYEEIEIEFYPLPMTHVLWSTNYDLFYVLGWMEEGDEYDLFVFSVQPNEDEPVEIAGQITNNMVGHNWLVDENNNMSIHSLFDGGLIFECWE